ncbi:MAG TPA: ammonium transporter, partial [Dongiaceae bacterium]|nr:ammonium transporter [Dongiaceae bacterium]
AGIFGQKFLGGLGGVSFISQLGGSVLAVVFALVSSYVVYGALHKTVGIRLSQEDEFSGADISIHNIGAYPEDSIR